MFISIRRVLAPVLALALLTSVLAFAPPAAAEETVYEAEGAIAGSNPLSSDFGGATETAFLLACAVPPNQGADGYVFELPEAFGAGDATVEVAGSDFTGEHDLDVFFYTEDCSSAGDAIATTAQDETGPIPAGTAWVVVNAWLGLDTAVSLKALRPAGDGGIDLALNSSAKRIRHGGSLKLSGSVTGCAPRSVEIYSKDARNGLVSVGKATVDEEGNYKKKVQPALNTTYFSEISDADGCVATRSDKLKVKVEPKIVVSKKRKCHWVKGRVAPKQPGSTVKLQRKFGPSWGTIDKDRLDSRSRFKLDFDSCRGSYRIRWSGAGSNMSSASRSI